MIMKAAAPRDRDSGPNFEARTLSDRHARISAVFPVAGARFIVYPYRRPAIDRALDDVENGADRQLEREIG